jgi:CheY-like chemotaxis protein
MAQSDLPTVLVADDDPDDLFFFRRLLLKAGVKNPVVTVEDGEQAISYLQGSMDKKTPPCVVFLDVRMAKVDGFEVLKWARTQPGLANAAFVFHTSVDRLSDRRLAVDAGALYLIKFPPLDQLKDLVRKYCEIAT